MLLMQATVMDTRMWNLAEYNTMFVMASPGRLGGGLGASKV